MSTVYKITNELLQIKTIYSSIDELVWNEDLNELKDHWLSLTKNKELDERGKIIYSSGFKKLIEFFKSIKNLNSEINYNASRIILLDYSKFIIFMAYYHVHGLIPDEISQSEGYKAFEQYIASGAPKDNFDGFELVGRFHAPETGEVFVILKADNHLAISEHFGIWRAKFGVEWKITAVLNDEEVIQRNKQVADAEAAMS